ncbi:hypothetical protein ATN89_17330 [Comamonas thiooxydans]|nr:hypothetical protein ATN89_17330 [Comamonas thiooxydans]
MIDSSKPAPADWSACRDASRNASCRALHMRHEEKVAGHALYFVPREQIKVADAAFTFHADAGMRKGEMTLTVLKSRDTSKSLSFEDSLTAAAAGSSYAEAVSKAAAAHKTTPKPAIEGARASAGSATPSPAPAAAAPLKPQVAVTPLPGESPLDFIARLRAAATTAPA